MPRYYSETVIIKTLYYDNEEQLKNIQDLIKSKSLKHIMSTDICDFYKRNEFTPSRWTYIYKVIHNKPRLF